MLKHTLSAILFLFLAFPALAQPSKSATELYNQGVTLKDDKKYSEALDAFKKAIGLKADYEDALYEAGWCSNELENFKEAITYLEKAKKLAPRNADIYRELGYAQWKLKKSDDAITTFKKAIELEPEASLPYRYLGNVYYYDKDEYEKAREYYQKYIEVYPEGTAITYYNMGWIENHFGNYDEAIRLLKISIERDAEDGDTYSELGYSYQQLDKADDAIDAYKEAMRLAPKSSAPYVGLGDIYKDLKQDVALALENYLKAIEVNPKSKKANYGAGWCYNDKEDYGAAIPYLKKALELDSKYNAVMVELGYSYYQLKRYDEALSVLDKANPTNLSSYYSGLCYVAKGQKDKAKKVYDKMKEKEFENAGKLLDRINEM